MRKTCFQKVYQLAKKHSDVVFVGSDLGAGVLADFQKEMPARFFMEGVSEQHLVGMCAGLAREGFTVYTSTIAPFLYRRPYEQIVLDAALHNLNIRFLSIGGGLVYAPLGPTHLAIEDLAIMRAVPNMTVVAPADAVEMAQVMEATYPHPGPVYIRIAKGGDPIVTPENRGFRIGKGYLTREGTDVLLVTTGITLQIALEAADKLKINKISVQILHLPTVKPLDEKKLINSSRGKKAVVTIEEHSEIGGLGSAVAEILITRGIFVPFTKIALPDAFPAGYGSQKEQLEKYGISAQGVAKTVVKLLKLGKYK
jgi:transketolase